MLQQPLRELPAEGLGAAAVLAAIMDLKAKDPYTSDAEAVDQAEQQPSEQQQSAGAAAVPAASLKKWGGIYHPTGRDGEAGAELEQLQRAVVGEWLSSNALYPGLWPSLPKFEAEAVQMVVALLNGGSEVSRYFLFTSSHIRAQAANPTLLKAGRRPETRAGGVRAFQRRRLRIDTARSAGVPRGRQRQADAGGNGRAARDHLQQHRPPCAGQGLLLLRPQAGGDPGRPGYPEAAAGSGGRRADAADCRRLRQRPELPRRGGPYFLFPILPHFSTSSLPESSEGRAGQCHAGGG